MPRQKKELTIVPGRVVKIVTMGKGKPINIQPAQRGAGENNQNQNHHDTAPQQN